MRQTIGWWQAQGWIEADPTIGIERRPVPPDRTKALSKPQIAALWQLDVSVREKTFWKLRYESVARADEILCRNIEELYPADKRGRVCYLQGWCHRVDSLAVRHRPALPASSPAVRTARSSSPTAKPPPAP